MGDIKGKILAIDDEQIITDLFGRFLPGQGYDYHFATNGPDGIKKVENLKPDLVFLDLKMPGMDGLETLKNIKEINKHVPVIMLTGHGDMDAAIGATRLGAYDFMQKPIDDLEALLIDIQRAIESYHLTKRNIDLTEELQNINHNLEEIVEERTKELNETLNQLKIAQKQINEEIKTVSIVQQNLLPESPPERENLDAAAIYLASDAVGGDYYDYIDLGNDRLGVVMADVSGHGLPAAFVMTIVKIMLSYLATHDFTLHDTIVTVNHILSSNIPTNNFVTLIYGIMNFEEMKFRYINAGHEPFLRVNQTGNIFEELEAKSPFLGIDKDTVFTEDTISIKKGDRLVFYTDGIVEAANTTGEIYGFDRFRDIIKNNMSSPSMPIITEILSSLSDHTKDTTYNDDITMMVLSFS